MSLREFIVAQLKENRPNLSVKSLATYASTLVNLPKKVGAGADPSVGVDWFARNTGNILEEMKEVTPNRRKSVLSALFILTGDKDVHAAMLADVKSVNENYKKQTKSLTETENWISWEDVLAKYSAMTKEANQLFKKKLLTTADTASLNSFVLLSCYVLFPVRRLLDYGHMKIRNFNETEDNYISKDKMVFNIYKTVKVYGRQSFKISKEFQNIVSKWMKIHDGDYLIRTSKNTPVSSPAMNAKLNAIFGKKISANILRHSFLTHFYGGQTPSYAAMQEMSQKMAHSVNMSLLYAKRDDAPSEDSD